MALASAKMTEVGSLDTVKQAENMLVLLKSSDKDVSADITKQVEMAEKQLGMNNVAFGSVDAKNHIDIAQFLQVTNAPSLVFKHKDGVLNLPNTSLAHDIVRDISSIMAPPTSTKMPCSDMNKHQGKYVMFFNGKASDNLFAKVHQPLAKEFGNEVLFAHSDDPKKCEVEGKSIEPNQLVLMRPFKINEPLVYDGCTKCSKEAGKWLK